MADRGTKGGGRGRGGAATGRVLFQRSPGHLPRLPKIWKEWERVDDREVIARPLTHVGIIVQILKLVPKDQQRGIGNL